MTEKEFLAWLHDRLVNVYGEGRYADFVLRLDRIANGSIVSVYPSPTDADEDSKEFLLPPVTVRPKSIRIGDITVPGKWIAKDSVTIKPGGATDVNRLTLTFLVGEIQVDDDASKQVAVTE